MKVSLVFLGSVGAGPVYSFQMAKALSEKSEIQLQIVISKVVDNIDVWISAFEKNPNVSFHKIDTYEHTKVGVALSFLNFSKINRLVQIVKRFEPDVTYFPFGCMWSAIAFPLIHRFSKIVDTVHDPHPFTHGYILSQYILVALSKPAERYRDGRIILNNKDKAYLEKKTKRPVAVVPHAAYNYYVDNDYKSSDRIHKQIAFIGRIDVYKGVDILVDAFSKIKTNGLRLLIAGSGQIDDQTMQKINENENIILDNRYIKNEEISRIMASTDLIILPYINATQSGVIPMAFAFGKAVIATNVGALSEQVPEGTGILTEVDSDDIAKAIDYMYLYPERILEYGETAKNYAEHNLSWNHSADLVIDFCKEIVSL